MRRAGERALTGVLANVSEVVEMRGLEPLTPAMRTQCSPN